MRCASDGRSQCRDEIEALGFLRERLICLRRTGDCELRKSSWKKQEKDAFAISRKAGAR